MVRSLGGLRSAAGAVLTDAWMGRGILGLRHRVIIHHSTELVKGKKSDERQRQGLRSSKSPGSL